MRRSLLVGFLTVLAAGSTAASGCAGVSPAHLGQTAGTIAGAAIIPGLGAPIGALAGMLAGMLVQGEVDKVTEKRERQELSKTLTGEMGSSMASGPSPHGEPTRVWVDETVQGGGVIAGHFEVRSLP